MFCITEGNATVKPLYGGKKNGFGHKAFSKFKLELANPYQLAILLLFNEQDKWSAPQLEASAQATRRCLLRCLGLALTGCS